jgi:DNA-binding response OmpR family regulator
MKKVLIADDEQEVAQSIRDALGSEFKVDIVHSGLEVFRLYRQGKKACEPYDAIILDVNFSAGINGLEVADLIRKEDQEVHILIFSAYDYSDMVRQRALDIRAEFRSKPLNPEEIYKFVQGSTS